MIYDKAYFVNWFTSIPDDKWTVGALENGDGQCCAMGHCRKGDDAMGRLVGLQSLLPGSIILINDGVDERYKRIKHPKHRMLAALNDLP